MASPNLADFHKILNNLKNRQFDPVYFLHGDEPYFIDQISSYIEHHVLTDAERGFNQQILYGKETEVSQIVAAARRFPMMSEYQVIIVKEAQHLKKLDGFLSYMEQPLPSTILVICHKNKKLDKRTKLAGALRNHILFESKRIYDNQVPDWINSHLKDAGFSVTLKGSMMLAEYLGTDLSRIANELEKLTINKTKGDTINEEDIEHNIGISREFNIFELQSAIASGNKKKAFLIAQHFAANTKSYPLVVLLGSLYSFYSKVYRVFFISDRSKKNVMSTIGVNFFQADDCLSAARIYGRGKIEKAFATLKEYDLRSKGINDVGTSDGALLIEMIYKLMN